MNFDYYLGTKAYNLFLQGIIFNNMNYSEYILDKKYINGAKVGFISNIFLAIKESLVDKKEERYTAKTFIKILENNVSLIADKKDNGYVLGGYLFKDAPTLISILRNKIGHGSFTLDLEHNRIILNVENNPIKVNIDKLTTFIIVCLNTYTKINNSSTYERDLIIAKNINKNREEGITNYKEIINFIKNKFSYLNIKLENKKNKIIDNYIINTLEAAINEYKDTNDIKVLYNLKRNLPSNYELSYSIKSLKEDNLNDFVVFLSNSIPNDTSYEESIRVIGRELTRYKNSKYNSLNVIFDNLVNICILDIIKKYNTTDLSYIYNKLEETYNEVYISQYTLASSALTMFTSLFSYNIDNIFKNDNKYTTSLNSGLDYSILDLSLIEVSINTIDDKIIKELNNEKEAKERKLEELNEKIYIQINNLNIVTSRSNIQAMTAISNNINLLNSQRNLLLIEYNNIINKLNICNNYLANNYNYLYNESIIEGIRNAISHGNYEVIPNNTISDTIIEFNDIYEGEITFKGKIKILDFIELIDNNANIINNYMNKNNTNKVLTKSI